MNSCEKSRFKIPNLFELCKLTVGMARNHQYKDIQEKYGVARFKESEKQREKGIDESKRTSNRDYENEKGNILKSMSEDLERVKRESEEIINKIRIRMEEQQDLIEMLKNRLDKEGD